VLSVFCKYIVVMTSLAFFYQQQNKYKIVNKKMWSAEIMMRLPKI
jgi:hypothetical protein